MKKKILFFNAIVFVFLYVIAEYTVFSLNLKNEIEHNSSVVNVNFFNAFVSPIAKFKKDIKRAEIHENTDSRISFRKTIFHHYDKNKNSILLYGCSFTYGVGLLPDENFSGQLLKNTNRLVYNRGISGYGIQHSLYHIENVLKELLDKNVSDKRPYPKQVIYTFIEDHVLRLYCPNDFFDSWLMFYKYSTNNKLVELKEYDMWFWHSYILRNFYFKKYHNSNLKKIVSDFDRKKLLADILIQMQKSLETQIKDVEFTIFVFDGDKYVKEIENRLIEAKINVVYLSELSEIDFSDAKYCLSKEDLHPNALAWEIITPLLVKKLNL